MHSHKFTIAALLLWMVPAKPSSAQGYLINTVAGGGPNQVPALSASIGLPSGIARDAAGNIYMASGDFTVNYVPGLSNTILKFDTAGNLSVVAGNGFNGYSGDGAPATQAEFSYPSGVAVDSAGNIFIADSENMVIREVVAATGIIQTVAGNGKSGYSGDGGKATQAELYYPFGVSVDGSGNIFIADDNNNVIREVVAATGIIQTVAGNGRQGYSGDGGKATQAELYSPFGVSVDGSGNIFVADANNNVIREVYAATGIIQTVAGNGTPGYSGDGGIATQAQLRFPYGVFVDSSNNILIDDYNNNVMREVYATTGVIQTVAGNGTLGYSGDGGPATQAELSQAKGVFADGAGNIFIADTQNHRVREVPATTGIIQTVAGNGFLSYSGDGGPATQSQLFSPLAVSVDGAGNIFIADSNNGAIRKVDAATGIIQTVATSGFAPGLFVDNFGNIFIADGISQVLEVVAATGLIRTVAGNGTPGYSGDGGPATQAELADPWGVFVDHSGNIFIADRGFFLCCSSRKNMLRGHSRKRPPAPHGFIDSAIRKVDAVTGIIQTVAGNATSGYSGDGGPATQADLYSPSAVFVDGSGTIFIADTSNQRIREVNATTGIIQTVAGNGDPGTYGQGTYSGDGGKATLAGLGNPSGVMVDNSGNIFISETWNKRIREVYATTQTIQTIAGNGLGSLSEGGFSGDGGWATQAELSVPSGLALDSASNIIFADQSSGRIRKLIPVDFQIAANPDTVTVTAGHNGQTTLSVTPVNGFNQPVSFTCTGLPSQVSCSASSVTPNGSPAHTTLTITTAAASVKLHSNPPRPSGGPFYVMLGSGLAGLAGLVSCGRRSRPAIRMLRFLAVLTVSTLWMAACGGGGQSGGGGTPVGNYTITVNSTSGPITKMTTLKLTVQ